MDEQAVANDPNEKYVNTERNYFKSRFFIYYNNNSMLIISII